MRLYLDSDVGVPEAQYLRDQGHNVFHAQNSMHSGKSDVFHSQQAQRENRVLVTRDGDFGGLRKSDLIPVTGVVYVRGKAANKPDYEQRLAQALVDHEAALERGSMVIIGAAKVRVNEPQHEKSQPMQPVPVLAKAYRESLFEQARRERSQRVHELEKAPSKTFTKDHGYER